MAIVRTIVTSGGAVVDISDAAYAGVSEEELERRRKNFYKIAERIFMKAELKKLREAEEAKKAQEGQG